MSKKIQLSIPVPCHEDWDKMSPVEKGKFCGSCQKQVVDFTRMSDREVALFFKKPSTGSVCGRFMTDQLNRDIAIPKKRIPWIKYFFQIALPALLFSKLSAQKTIGKVLPPVTRDTTRISVKEELRTLGMVLPTCIKPVEEKKVITALKGDTTAISAESITTINGEIKDESGLPITSASIYIKGTHIGTVSNEKGLFHIRAKAGDILQISSIGYEASEIIIRTQEKLSVQLKQEAILGGEVVVVTVGYVSAKKSIDYKQIIRGKVVDEDGNAIQDAKIKTGKSDIDIRTNGNGYFDFSLGELTKDSTIDISSAGFEDSKVNVDKEDASGAELYITLNKFIDQKLSVYPNPSRIGSTININLKEPQEGDYVLEFLNSSGQLTLTKEIRLEKAATLFTLEVPVVVAGNYFIVLTNKITGKKITDKIIVQ